LHEGAATDERFIARVEAFYRAQGRPVVFRIPDMMGGIDDRIAARGYTRDAPTRTLFADMADLGAHAAPDVAVETYASRRWLAARDRLSSGNKEAGAASRAIIQSILLPCGFAAATHRGRIVSLAFGAVQDDLLVVESVMTDPALRQRGHARACLAALFGWAKGQGVRAVVLQVMADNDPALTLYAGLGFRHDLHGYHYRMKP
jgi:ribosomal protein S18 acetylase RimI-like enzyme